MEERAGERRDFGCPSPLSSPHSSVARRRKEIHAQENLRKLRKL
jgi:hypothetical protein